MSQTAAGIPGRFLNADAYVTALAWSGGVCAFALGDGSVRLARADGTEMVIEAHDGAPLAIAAYGDGFVSGGDDGRLMRIGADGAADEIFKTRGKWIEHVAVSPVSGALGVSPPRLVSPHANRARARVVQRLASAARAARTTSGT